MGAGQQLKLIEEIIIQAKRLKKTAPAIMVPITINLALGFRRQIISAAVATTISAGVKINSPSRRSLPTLG